MNVLAIALVTLVGFQQSPGGQGNIAPDRTPAVNHPFDGTYLIAAAEVNGRPIKIQGESQAVIKQGIVTYHADGKIHSMRLEFLTNGIVRIWEVNGEPRYQRPAGLPPLERTSGDVKDRTQTGGPVPGALPSKDPLSAPPVVLGWAERPLEIHHGVYVATADFLCITVFDQYWLQGPGDPLDKSKPLADRATLIARGEDRAAAAEPVHGKLSIILRKQVVPAPKN